jgi:stage II sporulation protein M
MSRNFLLGLKKLFFDRILERSFWTWRKHPAIIIPSMMQSALSLILQSIVTLAVIILVTSGPGNPDLARLVAALVSSRGLTFILLSRVFWLTNIPLTIGVVTSAFIVAVVGGGWIYSAEYGTYLEAWNSDNVSVASVASNGSKRWKSMARTLLVSNLLTWGPAAVGLLLVIGSLGGVSNTAGLFAVLAASAVFVILLVASLILSVFTIYSYSAVVVDGASGIGAVRRSFRVASHNLGLTLTYAAVRIIFQSLLILLATFALPLGVTMLTAFMSLVLGIVLTPMLHLTKTMIYYHAGQTMPEMPFQISPPIWRDVFNRLPWSAWSRIKTGLREGSRFVTAPRNLPFHAMSIAAFALGAYIGYNVSIGGVGSSFLNLGFQPGHGNPDFRQLTGATPVLGLDIFLNNWLVSFATALSGLGFGWPSFFTILFNGFILGVLSGPQLSPSTTMFYAAILPHGIIEIPSFVLSGSVGIKLGYAALKTRIRPGLESSDDLSRTLRLAVYVVLGLAPLFLIAGLIEADVTPFIMRMFGWTF